MTTLEAVKGARKKKVPRPGFEDYTRVDMPDVVTFGTAVFRRNDGLALKVVFPAGQIMTFAPQDDILSNNKYMIEKMIQNRIDKLTQVGFTKEQAEALIEVMQTVALSGGMF